MDTDTQVKTDKEKIVTEGACRKCGKLRQLTDDTHLCVTCERHEIARSGRAPRRKR